METLGIGADEQSHWEQPPSACRAPSSATRQSDGLRVVSVLLAIFLFPFFVMWNCGAFDQPEPETQGQKDWNGCVEQWHGLVDATRTPDASGFLLTPLSKAPRHYAEALPWSFHAGALPIRP